MFIFFKFPAVQTFHLNQIKKIEPNGTGVYLRAEAEGGEPDEDYEENKFVFTDSTKAQEFATLVRDRSTN